MIPDLPEGVRAVRTLKPWVARRAEGCDYIVGNVNPGMKRCGHPLIVATVGKMQLCALHAFMLQREPKGKP